jgi:uncharacterized membrane protein YdjX (TVP38/TMEM64 family)
MINSPQQSSGKSGKSGTSGSSDSGGYRNTLRLLAGPVAILAGLIVAGRYAGGFWPEVEASVGEMGFSGYLLFCAAWVLLSVTCFPVSVLGVSAGALFGPWIGMALVFPSGLVGGSVMFWLGRGLLRGKIRKMIAARPKLAAVDRLAGEQELKLNILTRLSPLNYGLASYTLAAGPTSYRAFFWGMFAILPSSMAQVWFGSLAREAAIPGGEDGFSVGKMALLAGGLAFFLVLTWMVARMVKQAWDEAPADSPEE